MRSVLCLVCSLPALASPAVYEITFVPSESAADVRVRLESGDATVFRMPAWSPGDYRIVDYGKNVRDLRFTRLGQTVAHERSSTNEWKASGPVDSVYYRVATQRAGIFSENFRLTNTEAFVHGPAVFGYFEARKDEAQTLRIDPFPFSIATVAIGLTESKPYTFTAKNYDVLIDSPFVIGPEVRIAQFDVAGKLHEVAAFGPNGRNAQPRAYVATLQKVIGETYKIFGEFPYEKYTFLFDFGGDGGGLEHANSSRLAMRLGEAEDAAGFLAHEYFHAYNVKHIRSKPLGPFDYTGPAVTGALWWLEGVTDYYAEVLMVRAGIKSRDSLMRSLSTELRAFNRDPDRLRVSADKSSRLVWAAKNSMGYGINYYTKGKLIGWILDLAIRGETGGKKSLDDVMRALFAETKGGKPGFSENRIRELCIEIGGDNLKTIYDDCVLKPVELPIESGLARMGMLIEDGIVKNDPLAKMPAGAAWPN